MRIALVAALLSAGLPAQADELVVGALRDQDGLAIAGASVEALDASGHVLARDQSAADGTFAVTTAVRPATLVVVARDADPLRLAVPPQGTISGTVYRHRAVDVVPTVADVAALPAAGLGEVATTIPYWIAFPNRVGDRWLARGEGVTSIEGLPFYRNGVDASTLLPTHAIGSVRVTSPLQAPWYGDRSGGGVLDASLFDRIDTARLTSHDGAIELGTNPAALVATSWDPDGVRQLAAARGSGTIGPLAASAVALGGNLPNGNYSGIGATLRGATRTLDLSAGVAFTRDVNSATTQLNAGSITQTTFDATGRGPNAVALRLRWRDEHEALGTSSYDHRDGAVVVGTTRGTGVRVTTTLALAYGADRSESGTFGTGVALLPSLSADASLGPWWTLHTGLSDSTLGTPGVAISRASLGEAAISYADHHRLRVDFLAYAEGDDVPTAVTRGFAASLGWEIGPRLSLRAWSLRNGDTMQELASEYPGGPTVEVSEHQAFRRDLVWLTWDAPTRLDLLVRAGAIEGNLRIPLGAHYALTVGSARRLIRNTRQFSVGLSAR